MVESKITEEKLVNTKLYRDKAISRVDVLDKVKDLFLIPELEAVSMRMIADYYEVDIETVKKCYQHNCDEINSDGAMHKSCSELENVLKGNDVPLEKNSRTVIATLSKNVKIEFSNRGLKLFSKRAVLRFGMLLRDSKIAKEVRTQLLNVFEHSTNEQKTKEIDEEKQLLIDISLAYASGDVNRLLPATMKYQNYRCRQKNNAAIFKNAEKGFLRFGDLPKNGKSKNFANGNFEAGVSAFNAEFSGNNYRPILTDVLEVTYLNVVSRPAYRVWGKVVGTGADGEPLLKVTKFVKLN